MMPRKPILLAALLILLAACGTPATPAPTFLPTLVLPTRVAILPVGVTPSATLPVTQTPIPTATTAAPTAALASPTVAGTPTARTFATATKAAIGDATAGAALFANGKGNGSPAPACSTCHNVDSSAIKVGPSLKGVASRAASRVAGQDAATYLRSSIVNPSAFIVPAPEGHIYGTTQGSLMYATYGKDLSADDINNLVAYLLTLK